MRAFAHDEQCWIVLGLLGCLVSLAGCHGLLVPTSGSSGTRATADGVDIELRLTSDRLGRLGWPDRLLAALPAPSSYRISVRASDIAPPLTTTVSVESAGATLRVRGIPAGPNRLVEVQELSKSKEPIPGAVWMGVSPLLGTVEMTLNPATTAVGRVWERWLDQGLNALADTASPSLVADGLKKIREDQRVPHFALLEAEKWADAVAAADGSLDVGTAGFAVSPAAVDVVVKNAPEDVPAEIWIDDPVSPAGTGLSALTSQTPGAYRFFPVAPGMWTVSFNQPDYAVATRSITVSAGATATVELALRGWESGPKLPAPVGNAAVVSDDRRIYVLGGVQQGGAPTAKCWMLDTNSASPDWSALPDLPLAREGSKAAIVNGILYVVGGMKVTNPSYLATYAASWDTFALDLASPTSWSVLPKPAIAVSDYVGDNSFGTIGFRNTRDGSAFNIIPAALFGLNGQLVLLWNWADSAQLHLVSRTHVYDPVARKWTANPANPPKLRIPRLRDAFAATGDLVVVAGGDRSTRFEGYSSNKGYPKLFRAVSVVEGWRGGDTTWTNWPEMSRPRAELAIALGGGWLYAAGGVDAAHHPLKSVERFDLQARRWRAAPPMQTARSAFGLAYAGKKFWAIGGSPSRLYNQYGAAADAVALDTVETLDPGAVP